MRYLIFAVLLTGCCSCPDVKPALSLLRDTVVSVRKREKDDVVKMTPALRARLVEAEKLADKALELSK